MKMKAKTENANIISPESVPIFSTTVITQNIRLRLVIFKTIFFIEKKLITSNDTLYDLKAN